MTKSPQTHMKKPILSFSRFREKLLNITLLSLAAFAFLQKPQSSPMHIRTRIAGQIIFEGDVTPDTWCEVTAWEGGTLYKTQQVVWAQYKNLEKYRENSLDMWGWVWYYDGGRKPTNDFVGSPGETTPGSYPGVTKER